MSPLIITLHHDNAARLAFCPVAIGRGLRARSIAASLRVRLTISDSPMIVSEKDAAILERARLEVSSLAASPTLDEVRTALASIPGSLSHNVIAERGE